MDLGRAITFPFDDPDWVKKILIGAVVTLAMFIIPVIGTFAGLFLFMGWSYETSKRVYRNDPTPLPEWDDIGGLLGRGLTLFLAGFVYQIPTFILGCLAAAPFAPVGENEDMVGIATAIAGCCGCLILIYAIAASLAYIGGYIRYLDREEFGTFMQFGDNLALVRNNIGDFGMAIVFMFLGGLIAGFLNSTFIGALVGLTFQYYFTGHILGQLAQKLRGAMGGMSAAPAV